MMVPCECMDDLLWPRVSLAHAGLALPVQAGA